MFCVAVPCFVRDSFCILLVCQSYATSEDWEREDQNQIFVTMSGFALFTRIAVYQLILHYFTILHLPHCAML